MLDLYSSPRYLMEKNKKNIYYSWFTSFWVVLSKNTNYWGLILLVKLEGSNLLELARGWRHVGQCSLEQFMQYLHQLTTLRNSFNTKVKASMEGTRTLSFELIHQLLDWCRIHTCHPLWTMNWVCWVLGKTKINWYEIVLIKSPC